jgi:hypothetical protein
MIKADAMSVAMLFGTLCAAVAPAVGGDPKLVSTARGQYTLSLNDDPVMQFDVPKLGDAAPSVNVAPQGSGWQRVEVTWIIQQPVAQDELAIEFEFLFAPIFHWMPHLSPTDEFVVAQHVFRSPAIVAALGLRILAIVPDLRLVGQRSEAPWFMDLDAPRQKAWLGVTRTDVPVHVGFRRKSGLVIQPGPFSLAFLVTAYDDEVEPVNPWRRVSSLLWERYAQPLYAEGEPGTVAMDVYVNHTYKWAFDSWAHSVWQEFQLEGKRVGAPQFIVNVSESPNYEGAWHQREFLSIWNQTWFSSLRSASGLARWARRTGNADLEDKARLTKALALVAPMKEGLFPAVIRTENEVVEVDGEKVRRPKPWSEAFWTNSNRCPRNFGISPDWYHVLDASWTCLLMLRWYDDIEADGELLRYATAYAEKLLTLQDEKGFFPGWLHPETLKPAAVMAQTPETAMSVTFLLKLSEITRQTKYREAAKKAMDALLVEVVPMGRWEDYETYWSCCGFGQQDHVGKKFVRNNMYKQNNLSMFWTAEALLATYRTTGAEAYLRWGRRTLDELSMCQQVWQPPFIFVPALGGFGVMNFDGEWNDSRQSLFAELFMDYYRETGDPHLFERGVAALKASFIMMYCPENPQQKEQWEKAHPFFGAEDYGFMMENYGHGGHTSSQGGGIGTFTIYDWGNGAASEARNRVHDHYGDVFVDRQRGRAFGIDSIDAQLTESGLRLTDRSGVARTITVRFEDGSARTIHLDRETILQP